MFNIIWEGKALILLNKLDTLHVTRIIKKVDNLRENPFSSDVKRLKGNNCFRLRVGDYRIIFEVSANIIRILTLGHRKNIYKDL